MTIILKQDNTSPYIQSALTDKNGAAINLAGATILFKMWDADGLEKINSSASIVGSPADGIVKYDWVSGDTDTVGNYSAVFEVTYADTTMESFPLDSYLRVTILPESSDWTYGNNPGTADANERRDSVRILIGDTNATKPLMMDSEISFFLSSNNNDVYLAASDAAHSLSVKFAGMVDIEIDDLSVTNSQKSKQYLVLASSLKRKARRNGTLGVGGVSAGGVSKSDIVTNEQNSDRVEPAFKVNMYPEPNA